MGEENYDQDVQHESVEPLGEPQPVEETEPESSDESEVPIEAPEFVSTIAEGDTNQVETTAASEEDEAVEE